MDGISVDYGELLARLSIRKDVSVAVWDAERGLAEVVVKKGKLWCSTGVIRSSKLYCNVEEAVYLVGLGSLVLLQDEKIMSLDEVCSLLVIPSYGCSWTGYQTFAYLRRLGYIVGRHGVQWTISRKTEYPKSVDAEVPDSGPQEAGVLDLLDEVPALCDIASVSLEDRELDQISGDGGSASLACSSQSVGESNQGESQLLPAGITANYASDSESTDAPSTGNCSKQDGEFGSGPGSSSWGGVRPQEHPPADERIGIFDVLQPLSALALNSDEDPHGSELMFDVFLPNTRFKKSSPGLPAFRLCISSCHLPRQSRIRALELRDDGIPLKFALVECGHVSIFSFDTISIPELE